MRKIILFLIFSLICIACRGQGMNIWANDGVPQYIYVGSLMKEKNSSMNREKLKIEIFGGSYGSASLATTTYRIGTRTSYLINKEVDGGMANDWHILRVFENGDKFDFVIETIGWAAFVIKAHILDSNPIAHEVKCTKYDTVGKKDFRNQFTQTIFIASSANGNIGIGTDNPKSKLDVRGKITADEVEIKVNTGADYVFSPDYKLKSLSEVETFVKENRHLPDIPSEKEMQENGLNLNEMQIKLLQKVEELTLYVIELKKENEEQQNEIALLKKTLVNLKEK